MHRRIDFDKVRPKTMAYVYLHLPNTLTLIREGSAYYALIRLIHRLIQPLLFYLNIKFSVFFSTNNSYISLRGIAAYLFI